MTKNANAYDEFVNRTNNAWKNPADADDADPQTKHGREVIPPGGRVTVSMMAMGSVQRAIAGQADRGLPTETQATLDAMQRDADRVQGFADGFTQQRKAREQDARDENPARYEHEKRAANAWRNPPNYA